MYVLGDTLIDAGPNTAGALDVLQTLDLKSIRNVVITHGHVDHHGLARYVKNISDCTVYVHKNDFSAVSNYKDHLKRSLKKYIDFLKKSGISQEFIERFEQYYRLFEKYGENCECEVLPNTFETAEGTLHVIHTPGHTAGSCCFLLGDVLYSGDTLLPTISTNPSVHALFDERCGLENFQKSLNTILGLNLKEVLPGHGKIISDHKKRIQEILEEHAQRKMNVITALSRTPHSLVEITEKVFGSVPVTEIMLALAECYDHLRILEKEGIVTISVEKYYSFRLV